MAEQVSGVTLVPDGPALGFEQTAGRVGFVIPKIEGHQMVELKLS